MGSANVASEATDAQPVTASVNLNAEEDHDNGGEEDSNRQKQPIRKRTKTGCLSMCPISVPPVHTQPTKPASCHDCDLSNALT